MLSLRFRNGYFIRRCLKSYHALEGIRPMVQQADSKRFIRHRSKPITKTINFPKAPLPDKDENEDEDDVYEMVEMFQSNEEDFEMKNDEVDKKVDEQDDNEEEEIDITADAWRHLLEMPGRASWRATSDRLPEALISAQRGLLTDSKRTSKQLYRSNQKIFKSHAALAHRREKERRKLVNETNGGPMPQQLKSLDAADSICYLPEMSLSYLRNRLIPNYAIVRRVLLECQSLLGPSFRPRRVIDFGIGCGSSSAAALHVFESVDWIHGVEPSRSMRDGAERVLREIIEADGSSARVTLSNCLSVQPLAANTGGGFDLAICAYTAMEIPEVDPALAAVAVLWEKLRPNGILVMVEPGTPDGFNSVRAVRSMLLSCCPPDDVAIPGDDQCHIIAPCTHNGRCPMVRHKSGFVKKQKGDKDLPAKGNATADEVDEYDPSENDDDDDDDTEDADDSPQSPSKSKLDRETNAFDSAFCSFVHTIQGGKSLKGEKISYLVAQKRVFEDGQELKEDHADENPFHDATLTDLLNKTRQNRGLNDDLYDQALLLAKRYLESGDDELGLELVRGAALKSHGRIIRAPLKKRGHVYIDYCAAPGRIVRTRVTKASSKRAPGIFAAARKSRWGGLWPDSAGIEANLVITKADQEPLEVGLK